MEQYQKEFLIRTRKHIDLVSKYGMKIDRHYPMHDCDKLGGLFDAYSLMKKKDNFGGSNSKDNFQGLTPEEGEKLNEATLIHITTNEHHPEFWAMEKLDNFDRTNPPLGLHCEMMPEYALEEMCADWCAMSEEFKNTPFEWMEKTVPSRWIFSDDQIDFITNVLKSMWEN